MGNGEWGMGNGEWGMGNGEWGTCTERSRSMGNWKKDFYLFVMKATHGIS